MAQYLEEERHMREENLRLQRKLQREMERREALCRQLSESESSLEMDDERFGLRLFWSSGLGGLQLRTDFSKSVTSSSAIDSTPCLGPHLKPRVTPGLCRDRPAAASEAGTMLGRQGPDAAGQPLSSRRQSWLSHFNPSAQMVRSAG